MQGSATDRTSPGFVVTHPLDPEDAAIATVVRATAGVDALLDVWMGMPHGFPASIGKLKAAARALDAVGAFLTERLQAHASP